MTNEKLKLKVQKVIIFLSCVDPDAFIAWSQTKDCNKDNINKEHCALGWMGVSSKSPLYQKTKIDFEHATLIGDNLTYKINDLFYTKTGDHLTEINNSSLPEARKQNVIKALIKLEKML